MSVEFNHTIVFARDNRASAEFLAHILDLEVGAEWGPFVPVATGNGVTLDYATVAAGQEVTVQHYAFLVSEGEFDGIFERIEQAGITYYADPRLKHPGQINRNDGGRGMYFMDPAGHGMEVITRPYGSGSGSETEAGAETGTETGSGENGTGDGAAAAAAAAAN